MATRRTRRRRGVAGRILALLLGLAGVAVLAGGAALIVGLLLQGRVEAAASPSPTTTGASPHPTPVIEGSLLDDQMRGTRSCFVSLSADGVPSEAVRQWDGTLYRGLPVPRRDGQVFAGWYATAADAASRDTAARINGSKPVTCAASPQTLYGGWMTKAEADASAARVPILMYHQFTSKPEGESGWLRLNYTYVGDFQQQIGYLAQQQFYLPTWDELDAFIDGALYLPKKSVIVTDDDADPTWETLGVPVVTDAKVLTTSFVITAYRQAPSPSEYVLQRSHTNDMHTAGANGKGRMVNYTVPQIVADLQQSVKVLGVAQVLAYPYGQYNDNAQEGLRETGFDMAVTTEYGYVHPGSDKLALPRVRVNYGMTMAQFQSAVG
jgi:hypothetical protein